MYPWRALLIMYNYLHMYRSSCVFQDGEQSVCRNVIPHATFNYESRPTLEWLSPVPTSKVRWQGPGSKLATVVCSSMATKERCCDVGRRGGWSCTKLH